jgi:hypothetical protein
MMSLLPLADCARLLGVHSKTLRQWLKQANLPVVAHPTDARLKCLAEDHLHQLAALHGRPLHSPVAAPLLVAAAVPPPTLGSVLPEANLIQKLSCLESQVATLQAHVTQLVLTLLQERESSVEHRLTVLETVAAELGSQPASSRPHSLSENAPSGNELPERVTPALRLHPAEQRVRSRLPPLVEYAASGSYVIVSSLEGELSFSPDSSAWFDWLATISSFRFVGKQGQFTAYREFKNRAPTRSWVAYRLIHQRQRRSWLGVTDRLTTATLERAAATLQTYVDAL